MTAPKQAEAVMTSIPKFVSSIPEKPVAECNPLEGGRLNTCPRCSCLEPPKLNMRA